MIVYIFLAYETVDQVPSAEIARKAPIEVGIITTTCPVHIYIEYTI